MPCRYQILLLGDQEISVLVPSCGGRDTTDQDSLEGDQ